MDVASPTTLDVAPFSLQDSPTLIERLWPAQKISAEAQDERNAHAGQRLTALGSYWKGRKPLILVRACVLGALLPATDNPEKDLSVFECLMAIDDRAFLKRTNLPPSELARRALAAGAIVEANLPSLFTIRGASDETLVPLSSEEIRQAYANALAGGRLRWREEVERAEIERIMLAALSTSDYLTKVSESRRPEQLDESVYDDVWADVNEHLGTNASNFHELVEQLGIKRFGRRPNVGDVFCGGGSIPFEAARLGCDVHASDLNPIACLLTWGALNLIGADQEHQERLRQAQQRVSDAVDQEIRSLGVEFDEDGNRAKAYLYCLETRCPETGWMVPLAPSWLISKIKRTVAKLVPDHANKRFSIEIVNDVSDEEMLEATKGTVQNGNLVYTLNGIEYSTSLRTIRGDIRTRRDGTGNKLRLWGKHDFVPAPDDVFQERLYCIQWMKAETLHRARPTSFFAAPTEADLACEQKIENLVLENLERWQSLGFIPDMEIERGEKTEELIRTRGWTHWHHLFNPRQLLLAALVANAISEIDDETVRAYLSFDRTFMADKSAKLSHWRIGSPGKPGRAASADGVENVFYNQAFNTFYNYGARGFTMIQPGASVTYKHCSVRISSDVKPHAADEIEAENDIFITDPPYADAVIYHEITEFLIAWLRNNPPEPFKDWIWDSRRALAVQGEGEEFRQSMVNAYKAMADHMPDNGLQIVMFTHQSGEVWADMAQIFWGAGLRVMGAWYIATETTSELKKGGYVQGTVILVLRKRLEDESGYKDEIVQEVRAEVAHQIDTMVGLNQTLRGHGRIENLFEDADLQMAGYAAALRVLTGYSRIDGVDMTKEALRPRQRGERSVVGDIIEFAVQVANEHMVPDGMDDKVWARLTGSERFYFRMMDVETTRASKLDSYQNFAKAFRVPDYTAMMGSMAPNRARLKRAAEFKKADFVGSEFAVSPTRAVLYALYEIQQEVEGDDVLSHLRDLVERYLERRDDLAAIASYIAAKRLAVDEDEARAARILHGLIRNERLG